MNPWLDIDISDYVNHMSSPEVGQYQLINLCFKTILQKHSPRRIFIPGCTIGNGFEYISWDYVEIVTALDINPEYLKILKDKFPGVDNLEIVNADFQTFNPEGRKYNVIFSALFFEYVDLKSTLNKIKDMMNKSSVLFSMIQLPDENQSKVSKTEYKSLQKLSSFITLTTAKEFRTEIEKAGLIIKSGEQKTLPNGKSFLLTESVLK